MIFAYIVLVLVVYYLVDRKKRKRKNNSPESEEQKNGCLTVLCDFAVFMFIIYIGFIILFVDAIIVDDWRFFGKKRTAEIESMYGITVDDDIKLKNYRVTSWMEGKTRRLEFESDIDGLSFMEKNCQGELLRYAENDLMQELEKPDIEPYKFPMSDEESGIYRYEYQNREYQMTFYSEGNSYRVIIYLY